ncbi:MAG: hypothetical protein BWY45_00645 [Euryarchaeota archaeon ADurb.Bin294]|nr:MAG: hypothetical protein BWY45_00645 [Euryarchaeota archaeon ADurb.Bin294]
MNISLYLQLGLIMAFIVGVVSATDNQIPNDIQTAVVDALTKADLISFTDESEQSRELIQTVREEFTNITGQISDYSGSGEITSDTAGLLTDYIQLWDTLLVAYDFMIQGGDHKLKGYDAILSNETNRYETGLQEFKAAKEMYDNAYEGLNNTQSLFSSFDVNKMLFRLRDTALICQAYQDFCSAEIAKETSGDVNSTEVQEPLNAATTMMKKLIPSPYVGQEAELFANITFT